MPHLSDSWDSICAFLRNPANHALIQTDSYGCLNWGSTRICPNQFGPEIHSLEDFMAKMCGVGQDAGSRYPAGSVGLLDQDENVFRIYAPPGSLRGCCALPLSGHLGATPPEGYLEVGREIVLPTTIPYLGVLDPPWYKQPWVWAVSGAVLVYLLMRKRAHHRAEVAA